MVMSGVVRTADPNARTALGGGGGGGGGCFFFCLAISASVGDGLNREQLDRASKIDTAIVNCLIIVLSLPRFSYPSLGTTERWLTHPTLHVGWAVVYPSI